MSIAGSPARCPWAWRLFILSLPLSLATVVLTPVRGAVDPICTSSVAESKAHLEQAPKRALVLFRGEGYRDWGEHGTDTNCCAGTREQQLATIASHRTILLEPLKRRGFDVDCFVSTYTCTTGEPWAQEDFSRGYAECLRGATFVDKPVIKGSMTPQVLALTLLLGGVSEQITTYTNTRELSASPYSHVFVIRLDFEFTALDLDAIFEGDRVLTGHQLQHENWDQFQYVPGRYLPCWIRHRSNTDVNNLNPFAVQHITGETTDESPIVAGMQAPILGMHKANGERIWMQRGIQTQPPWRPGTLDVPCVCGEWINLVDRDGRARSANLRVVGSIPTDDYCPSAAQLALIRNLQKSNRTFKPLE